MKAEANASVIRPEICQNFWPKYSGHETILKFLPRWEFGFRGYIRSKSRLRPALQSRDWSQYFGLNAKLVWRPKKGQNVSLNTSGQDWTFDIDAKAWNSQPVLWNQNVAKTLANAKLRSNCGHQGRGWGQTLALFGGSNDCMSVLRSRSAIDRLLRRRQIHR